MEVCAPVTGVRTTRGQGAAASQGAPRSPVTLGASYRNRVVADPESMSTRSCTMPVPGPGGALHVNSPRPATSVMEMLVQAWVPMVTSMTGLG